MEADSFDKKFVLPHDLNPPVGMFLDDNNNNNKNSGDLWITNGGSSLFYKLNPNSGKITKFVTSKPSPRIFGQGLFEKSNEETRIQNNDIMAMKTSLNSPILFRYWIQKASDGSIWFNEQEGNKIGTFDPHEMKLVEYWVPSQNSVLGSCSNNISSNKQWTGQDYGIANVLQFS